MCQGYIVHMGLYYHHLCLTSEENETQSLRELSKCKIRTHVCLTPKTVFFLFLRDKYRNPRIWLWKSHRRISPLPGGEGKEREIRKTQKVEKKEKNFESPWTVWNQNRLENIETLAWRRLLADIAKKNHNRVMGLVEVRQWVEQYRTLKKKKERVTR